MMNNVRVSIPFFREKTAADLAAGSRQHGTPKAVPQKPGI
jgi:hypothetical protein